MFKFAVADYIVFGASLLLSVLIGIFYAIREKYVQRNNRMDNYLMGGRDMSLLPVALSLLVSFQSGILILGDTAEMYTRGITFWWAWLGISISALITCYLFVPIFYNMRLNSVYEYLELRYKLKLVRKIGALLYIFVTLVYLSVAIYAPSLALNAVTGIPLWILILLAGFICSFYVSIGGLKAVVWTDVLQAFVMLAGILAVLIEGLRRVGGISRVLTVSATGKRIDFKHDLSFDPLQYMNLWGAVFGQVFSWLGWYGINQSSVQRYCGMKTLKQGQAALLLNIPGLFLVKTLIDLCGLIMYTYYVNCDPLKAGLVDDKDQLAPYFVLEILQDYSGLSGLFIACIFSGTLSTVSSGLNSLSMITWEDFLKSRDRCKSLTPSQSTMLAKILAALYGLLATALAFLSPFLGGVLSACLSLMGAINGPLTGLFMLGALVPWVNKKMISNFGVDTMFLIHSRSKKGAVAGASVSFIFLVTLCIGAHITSPHNYSLSTSIEGCDPNITSFLNSTKFGNFSNSTEVPRRTFFSISFALYGLIGVVICFIIAIPISAITGFDQVTKQNRMYYNPYLLKFYEKIGFVDIMDDEKCEEEHEFLTLKASHGE